MTTYIQQNYKQELDDKLEGTHHSPKVVSFL